MLFVPAIVSVGVVVDVPVVDVIVVVPVLEMPPPVVYGKSGCIGRKTPP